MNKCEKEEKNSQKKETLVTITDGCDSSECPVKAKRVLDEFA